MDRRAFTLIELLIAAALAVLVLGAVAGVVAAGLRVWDRARSGSSPLVEASMAMEWLQRDLHNASMARSVSFDGAPDNLRFPVLAEVDSATSGVHRLVVVRYAVSVDGAGLCRTQASWPAAEPVAADSVVLDGVAQGRFKYCDEAGEWNTTWHNHTNLPSAVAVTLQLKQDRGGLEVRRVIELPVAQRR